MVTNLRPTFRTIALLAAAWQAIGGFTILAFGGLRESDLTLALAGASVLAGGVVAFLSLRAADRSPWPALMGVVVGVTLGSPLLIGATALLLLVLLVSGLATVWLSFRAEKREGLT